MPGRAFALVWRASTRALERLPLSLRGPRQLAREAVADGALQKVPELAGLAALLHANPPAAVLEIGSYRGGTLSLWCKLARPDAVIVAVDLPVQYGRPADEHRLRGVAHAGQRLTVVLHDSHEDDTRSRSRTGARRTRPRLPDDRRGSQL